MESLEIVRESKPDLERQLEALLALLRAVPARSALSETESSLEAKTECRLAGAQPDGECQLKRPQ